MLPKCQTRWASINGPNFVQTLAGLPQFLIFIVLLLIVLLGFAPSLLAKTHPVPLDPKADASTCITCHEDKTKGKAVHSAIAMGCLSCHEIRVNKATPIRMPPRSKVMCTSRRFATACSATIPIPRTTRTNF